MKMVKYCKARHAVKSRGETLIAVIHSNLRTVQLWLKAEVRSVEKIARVEPVLGEVGSWNIFI